MQNVISADRAIDEADGNIPRAGARLGAVARWNERRANAIDNSSASRRRRGLPDMERLRRQAEALHAVAAELAAPQEMRMAA
jgi:hypothetical protein